MRYSGRASLEAQPVAVIWVSDRDQAVCAFADRRAPQ
jgi:hypothetical protein